MESPSPLPLWKKVLYTVAGVALIAVGAFMGFVPVLQGWIFALAGLYLLAKVFPAVRRPLQRVERRVKAKLAERRQKRKARLKEKSSNNTDTAA